MTDLHDDLIAVLDAVEIESPTRYSLLGEVRELGSLDGASPTEPGRLVSALTADLYGRLYIRPSPRPSTEADGLARRDLMAALSAANTGRGTWEAGWTIRRIEEDGQFAVARSDILFWVSATGLRTPNATPQVDMSCRVWIPKEMRSLLPGFYFAYGDADGDDRDANEPGGRYYWHLTREIAVPFMKEVAPRLNEAGIPFQVKVLSDPDAYHRADAGVLFFSRRDQDRIAPVIARIHASVAGGLRLEVPLFTKRVADGLGFAEDPSGSRSFGDARCQLVAETLWQSFVRGEAGREARAAALASDFRREGLDPLRPHLGPGSLADWGPEPFESSPDTVPTDSTRPGLDSPTRLSSSGSSPITMLEAAIRIGRTLCESAFWDPSQRLCNWVGRATAEVDLARATITPTSSAPGSVPLQRLFGHRPVPGTSLRDHRRRDVSPRGPGRDHPIDSPARSEAHSAPGFPALSLLRGSRHRLGSRNGRGIDRESEPPRGCRSDPSASD